MHRLGFIALLTLSLTGCGTINNLLDSPKGPLFAGTGCCYPFGGALRSGMLAFMGPPMGVAGIVEGDIKVMNGEPASGFQLIGTGSLFALGGLGAIADAPVSLCADLLTLPIVYARMQECPWATWWGKESLDFRPPDPSRIRELPQSTAGAETPSERRPGLERPQTTSPDTPATLSKD